MVPAGTPGFTVEPAYDKLGWHVSDTHGLSFEDCRVPADNLLGEPGQGFRQFLKTLDDGRIAISALAVGLRPGLPRAGHRLRARPASPSAGRSASTRASPSRSPTSPSWSRPLGC